MPKRKTNLIHGTLDMLVLRALRAEALHDLGSADRFHLVSSVGLRVEQGSLYPPLYRLEAEGSIRSEWGGSGHDRKAHYSELTGTGRKRLTVEAKHWECVTAAASVVLAKA